MDSRRLILLLPWTEMEKEMAHGHCAACPGRGERAAGCDGRGPGSCRTPGHCCHFQQAWGWCLAGESIKSTPGNPASDRVLKKRPLEHYSTALAAMPEKVLVHCTGTGCVNVPCVKKLFTVAPAVLEVPPHLCHCVGGCWQRSCASLGCVVASSHPKSEEQSLGHAHWILLRSI